MHVINVVNWLATAHGTGTVAGDGQELRAIDTGKLRLFLPVHRMTSL